MILGMCLAEGLLGPNSTFGFKTRTLFPLSVAVSSVTCPLWPLVSDSLPKLTSASLHPDVNSWLLTFGFQLHNVIPGYPKPDTDAMEPSYELMHTQMKTQEWDNSKVMLHMTVPPQPF